MSATEPIDLQALGLSHAINRAVSECLNAFAPDLPPQSWTYFYSDLEIWCMAEGETALEQWADRLGLNADESVTAGTRTVAGEAWINYRRHTIRAWCVVDQEAYDVGMAAFVARCGS